MKEELILLWRSDIFQHSGWLQTLEDVRILALEVVQERDPDAEVGGGWVRSSLYKQLQAKFNADKRKRAKDSKTHLMKFLQKVCNLPIMQNFRRIF